MSPRELDWEVALPERRRATLGAPRPRGTLTIRTQERGEERISLPVSVARMLSARKKADEIHPGSRAELLYVTKELSLSSARSRIERLIDRREYASSEIRRKLREDGYHSDVIDQCVKRACEAGLVSDQRFADSFIRSKVYSGWGMARIARELSRRGIEADTLPGWPYEYLDPEDELSRAVDLARTRRVYGPRAYEKLVRHLCGKGFSMSVATKAASQVLGEREAYED